MSTFLQSEQDDFNKTRAWYCCEQPSFYLSEQSADLNSTSFEFNTGETEWGEGRLLYEKCVEKYGSV